MANHNTRIMFTKTYFVILILFCIKCKTIFGQSLLSEQKSSLTFIIDDTMSMRDDIDQVKASAKLIFNTVLESKASRIGNFVLVRFNDPDITPALITSNKEEYIRALDDIKLQGNDDCPEMAMKGLEEGLIKSLSRSYIFVFTDASAKDYRDFAKIKRIAQEKSSQIIFVLTGLCTTEEDPAYVVYHDLAKATSGQVFHLEKSEINKILQYVLEIVKAPRTLLAEAEFRPGYDNTLIFIADGKVSNIIVATSGKNPRVKVLDPSGAEAKTEIILQTANIAVIMITNTEPGKYNVIVGSLSNTKVIITGATTFDFTYGFSTSKPASIRQTVTRPVAGEPSYLAILLDNPDHDVELKEVNLIDTNNKVLQVLPLNKVGEDFYVTEPTTPPNTMFKILVKGFTKGTKTPVQRMSTTPIEPEMSKNTPPLIKEDDTTITTESGKLVDLHCVVSGFPTPKVSWTLNGGIVDTTHVIFLKNNTLRIRASLENAGDYTCEAVNVLGSARKTIQVIVNELPKIKSTTVTTLEKLVGCSLTLTCEASGYPKPEIQWKYYNGDITETILGPFDDLGTLHKPLLKESDSGNYVCIAENSLGSAKITYTVIVLTPPSIKSTKANVEAVVGDSGLELMCQATGNPKPIITWIKDGVHLPSGTDCYSDKIFSIKKQSTLVIRDVDEQSKGTYACVATNIVGMDIASINVVVSHPKGSYK